MYRLQCTSSQSAVGCLFYGEARMTIEKKNHPFALAMEQLHIIYVFDMCTAAICQKTRLNEIEIAKLKREDVCVSASSV